MRITETYTGPSRKVSRRGKCLTCGKTVTRSRTFTATVNPFNVRPDGTPKTWVDVTADVDANAAAWSPSPDEFEHNACYARRNAPDPASPAPVSPERQAHTERIRGALHAVINFCANRNLPVGRVEVRSWAGKTRAELSLDGAEVPAWARVLDVDTVTVERGQSATFLRFYSDVDTVTWFVSASVLEGGLTGPLGDAPITWATDSKGRRQAVGTVTVAELAAGLSRMGIAVTDPQMEVAA